MKFSTDKISCFNGKVWRLILIFSWLLGCRGYTVLEGTPSITLSDHRLKEDTLLRGNIIIKGILEVPVGIRLQIAPGTIIAFKGDLEKEDQASGIRVEGVLEAVGKPDARIRFISANGLRWGEIRIDESPGSVVRYADFQQAFWGLHIHFTHMEISHCRFKQGIGGIRFGSGPVIIQNNLFEDNRTAIRYIIADPIIRENTFAEQQVAIFVRGGSSKSRIHLNNFQDSSRFHIKLGEEQTADLSAIDNWWGTADLKKIGRYIYDKRDSKDLGLVKIHPVAKKAFK